MKKFLSLITVMLATIGVANAQDYMFVTTPGGGVTSFRIEDLAEVQFTKAQDYNMTVLMSNGEETTFRVDEINEIIYADAYPGGWTFLGYCLYGEDFIGSLIYDYTQGDLSCEYYVEVHESMETPGLYRLVDPYSPDIYPCPSASSSSISYDTATAPHWYIEINATDPNFVYIEYQDTGMSWGRFGRFYVYSYAAYYHDDFGQDWSQVKENGWGGTLKDGVITFKYAELASHWPEYNKYCQDANIFEKFKIDLNDKSERPGAKNAKKRNTATKDSSINVQGYFTNGDIGELEPYNKKK